MRDRTFRSSATYRAVPPPANPIIDVTNIDEYVSPLSSKVDEDALVDALHNAVRNNRRRQITALLNANRRIVNERSRDSFRTALHVAAAAATYDEKTIQLLLAYGADVRALTTDLRRAVDLLRVRGAEDTKLRCMLVHHRPTHNEFKLPQRMTILDIHNREVDLQLLTSPNDTIYFSKNAHVSANQQESTPVMVMPKQIFDQRFSLKLQDENVGNGQHGPLFSSSSLTETNGSAQYYVVWCFLPTIVDLASDYDTLKGVLLPEIVGRLYEFKMSHGIDAVSSRDELPLGTTMTLWRVNGTNVHFLRSLWDGNTGRRSSLAAISMEHFMT